MENIVFIRRECVKKWSFPHVELSTYAIVGRMLKRQIENPSLMQPDPLAGQEERHTQILLLLRYLVLCARNRWHLIHLYLTMSPAEFLSGLSSVLTGCETELWELPAGPAGLASQFIRMQRMKHVKGGRAAAGRLTGHDASGERSDSLLFPLVPNRFCPPGTFGKV